MRERYIRAERLLPWRADALICRAEVRVNWLRDSDSCWYRVKTRDGHEFVSVDPVRRERFPAFDHARLAAALSTATGVSYHHANLPIERFAVIDDTFFEVTVAGATWRVGHGSYQPVTVEAPPSPIAGESISPDGRWAVSVVDSNLALRETATGQTWRLTTDGEPGHAYGTAILSPLVPSGVVGADQAPPICVLWSPDSRYFVSHRIDERGAGTLDWVQSTPLDGSLRPKLHTATYPLPGDEVVPMAELLIGEVATQTVTRPAMAPLPVLYYGSPLLVGPPSGVGSALTSRWIWWDSTDAYLYVLRRERGFQSYTLLEVDAATGQARELVREHATTGIDPHLTSAGAPNVRVIAGRPTGGRDRTRRRDIIWFSQRDGWGHLYLYSGASGKLRRQVTVGPWAVADVVHVDETERIVYFTAVGREPGDPYRQCLYRVKLDGDQPEPLDAYEVIEPELLTPEDADHQIQFSPSGHHFIDTYSRLDQPPITVMRRASGALVCELERAEIDQLLATGWRYPERFSAKARDGVTDIYGVIFWPSRVDSGEKLPVLDYIYAGPQVNQAPVGFADLNRGRSAGFWQAQALAELGFAVVMIDGLGMPYRWKAYHDISYGNVADGGIPDHIAGLRQLADRYPYLDLDRVGVYGHSAGGYASARAILGYPDFYKVAVSSAGLHHHRWDKASWNERYSGLYAEHYEAQANTNLAANLRGKLFLAHGEMDENVHVFNTLRLVDALVKANKDFDLLILPNRPHACFGDAYLTRRRWDYFVRHLLGVEPPEYAIAGPTE